MTALSDNQKRLCAFVGQYRQQHGVSPIYAEIGEHLGVTKQAVQYQVKALVAQGYLAKPRDVRSLMVTDLWRRYHRHLLDRDTNPLVPAVADEQPDLFARFTDGDWETLYSTRGVGGALTRDGVLAAARRINDNRDLRQRAAELLENGSVREELIAVIDELWQRVTRPRKRRPQQSSTPKPRRSETATPGETS